MAQEADDKSNYVPDMAYSDIYLGHLQRLPLSGWWRIRRVSADRIDHADDEGRQRGYTDPDCDDSGWDRDLVPGNLQSPFLSEVKTRSKESLAWGGVAYFRRDFVAPAQRPGERYFLHFDDVNGNMAVYVNGKHMVSTTVSRMDISEYKGPTATHDIDVTAAVIPGGRNQVAIRFYHSGKPVKPWGYGNTIGILGPVYLDVRPAQFARDILVTPQADLAHVLVECTTGGEGEGTAAGWTGEVFEWDSGKVVAQLALAATARAGGSPQLSGEARIDQAKLWSCESPFLYGVKLRDHSGATVGVKRFGMRSFGVRGSEFLLNGQPVFLRGIVLDQALFGFMTPGNLFGFKTNQRQLQRRYWQAIRDLNVNHIRFHSTLMNTLTYDLLDEMGILCCDELSFPQQAIKAPKRSDKIDTKLFAEFCDDQGELSDEFRDYLSWRLRYLYSHPAAATFSFGNEIRQGDDYPDGRVGRMFNRLYDLYHGLDKQNRPCTPSSGRFWKETSNMAECAAGDKLDYIDTHDYTGTINNLPLGYVEYSLQNFIGKAKEHFSPLPPIVNGELLCIMNNYYPWAFDDTWASEDADEPNWPVLLKVLNTFHEEHRDCAQCCFCPIRNAGVKSYRFRREESCTRDIEFILSANRKAWPELDGFEALQKPLVVNSASGPLFPYDGGWQTAPRGKALQRASAPSIAIFDYVAPNRFGGDELPLSAHVINNSESDIAAAVLRVQMVLDERQVAEARVAVGAVKRGEKHAVTLALRLPAEPGYYELRYTLLDGDKALSTSALEINLRARAAVFAPIPTTKAIALYDRSDKFGPLKSNNTRTLLDAFGLKYTLLEDFSALAAVDVLIIGSDSMDAAVRRGRDRIREFLRRGGRCLVFEQSAPGGVAFLPGLEYRQAGAVQFSEILRFKHPLLATLSQRDFHCWNQRDMAIYHYFISPVSEAAITHGGDSTTWGSDNFGMTNAHVRVGAGDAILTQMELSKLSAVDSAAAQMARNALLVVLDDATRSWAAEYSGHAVVDIAPVEPARLRRLSLAAAATMGFADPVAKDGQGGWSDQGPDNDIHAFPIGEQEFSGIGFGIVDPASNAGRSCVIVSANSDLPFKPESRPIAIGMALERLFFLHSGAWIRGKEPVGEYLVSYADGSTLSIPLTPGDNFDDWWGAPSKTMRNAVCAWSTSNAGNVVGVYLFAWQNPRPEQLVVSITARSFGNAMIGLIGLSAEATTAQGGAKP